MNWSETSPSTTGPQFRVADSRQVALRCLIATTSTITMRFDSKIRRLEEPNQRRATQRSTHRHTQKSWTMTTGMPSSRADQFRTRTRGNSLQRKETETKTNVDERVENVYKKRHIIPQRFKNMSLENDIQVSESEDMELKQEILTEKYQANLQKFENRTIQNGARTEEANHPRPEEASYPSTSANRPYFEMNPHMINRQGRSMSEVPSGPEQPKFQSKLEFTFAANDDMKQKTAIQVKNKISSRRFSLSLPRNISTSQPSVTYSNFPNHQKEQTLNNNRSPETAGFAGGNVIRESDKSRIFVGNQTKLDEDEQNKKQILNRWSNQYNAGDQALKRGDSGNMNRFQSPDGSRNQLPIQSPDGSRNQLPIQSPEGSRNRLPIKSPEGSRNQMPNQSPEGSRNRLPNLSPEGSRNRLPIQSQEGSRNRLQIQSPDGGRNQEFRNTPDAGVKNLKFWQFMQTGQVNNSERDKSPATFSDSGTNRSDDQDQPPISINNGRINNSNGPNQQAMPFNNGRINNSKGPNQQPMSFNNGRINNSNEPNQQPMSFNNGRINNSNGPNQQPMSFNNGRINNSNGPNQSYNNNNSYRRSDQFPIQNQNANNNHQENSKVNSFGNTEMEQTGQAENWNRGRQRMRSTSLLVQNLNTPTATTMDRKTTNYSIQLGTSQDSGSENRMGENKADMRQINWQGEPQRTWQNDPWKTWQDEQNDRDFRSRSRQIKQTPNFLQQNIQNDDILQNQGASREPQQHQVQNNIQSNATRKQFQYNNQSNQTRQPFQYNNQSNQTRQPFQYNNQSNQTRQQFQNYNQSNQTRQTNSSLIDQWRPLNSGNPANERERFRQQNMQEYDYCQTEKDTSYLSPARTKIQLRCSSVPPQDLESKCSYKYSLIQLFLCHS